MRRTTDMNNPNSPETERILLAHGGGGRLARNLIRDCFLSVLDDPELSRLSDSALIDVPAERLAFTTDSFVVKPLFFRGGDIGRLAVCGTVNDLAAVGASPLCISLAVIVEEGLPLEVLRNVASSVAAVAREAGVRVVCGDTKVVERGAADQLFLTTSGIGLLPTGLQIGPQRITPGDLVILSGTLADHTIAVMSAREGLGFQTTVLSDVAPLADLTRAAIVSGEVHAMRDPTRGGLAAVLNELAEQARVGIEIDESAIPISPAVRHACDLLGLDPLHAANEGKMVIIGAASDAPAILKAVRSTAFGKQAVVVGRVGDSLPGTVWLRTSIGGRRIVDPPMGELLPRIC